MGERQVVLDTRATYDTVASDYAGLLPDLLAETSLDRAMLATFAELTLTAALGPVADLGCGTGRVAAHLHSLGVEVFGVDLSPGMVDLARRTYPHLRFNVGSITALELPDACLSGALAWYSTIHTPPSDLPTVFSEFARVLAPRGYLLVGFHVGEGPRLIAHAYGHAVSLDAYDVSLEMIADLDVGAGLAVHTQLERAAQGDERRPQGRLIAAKPFL
ncbi:MAG: class I SAM-dependent methyltransferase [Acidimicrobiales bacterium]